MKKNISLSIDKKPIEKNNNVYKFSKRIKSWLQEIKKGFKEIR
jgi:hypothetical protein